MTVDSFRAHALAVIEAMLDAVWLVDGQTLQIIAANRAAGRLLGCDAASLVGEPALSLAATPEDLSFWEEARRGIAAELVSETYVRRFDGGTASVLRRISPMDIDGRRVHAVVLHDRSERRRIERELELSAAELSATLESTADGILVTDLAGRIRNFNRRFADLWDVPEDLLQQRQDDALHDWMCRSVTDADGYLERLAVLREATLLQASDVLTLRSGKVLERITLPQCSQGRPIGRVYSFRDITERRQASERIEQLSHTDALTGLPNRCLLADRIERAVALGQREGVSFAVLLLNLDHFKHVNETLGHALADRVLVEIAERTKACVRHHDTVARLAGDEFAVLVQRTDAVGAESTARRVMDALQRPFTLDGFSFTVTASIGIALYPDSGRCMDDLLVHADTAMREVKAAGRSAWRIHQAKNDPGDEELRRRMRLDHAMRQGLAQQRFRLEYQPQVHIPTGAIVGAEALIRWRDPELGDVAPGDFIPVAEESGFIVAIGDWVLRRAVRQAADWLAQGRRTTVSVNVSALQFRQPGFVDGVAQALRAAGLPPELLELELTESILIQDADETLARLTALRRLGVLLAIDDFGTGYSSLGYLKRLPIGRLKIDRSFVSGLPGDRRDAGIVHAIVNLGRALGIAVIAEGVESEAQRAFLRQVGCDQLQGFLCAGALEPEAFAVMLDAATGMGARTIRLISA